MNDTVAVIAPALLGLAGGVIGSLVAPWIHWGIEKRKIRLESRREFVRSVRELLAKPPTRENLRNHPLYAQIRPHLTDMSRSLVESETVHVQLGGRGGGVNNFIPSVLDDLNKLEKKWGLL